MALENSGTLSHVNSAAQLPAGLTCLLLPCVMDMLSDPESAMQGALQ